MISLYHDLSRWSMVQAWVSCFWGVTLMPFSHCRLWVLPCALGVHLLDLPQEPHVPQANLRHQRLKRQQRWDRRCSICRNPSSTLMDKILHQLILNISVIFIACTLLKHTKWSAWFCPSTAWKVLPVFICPSFLGIYSFAGTNLLQFRRGDGQRSIFGFQFVHVSIWGVGNGRIFWPRPYMISSVSKASNWTRSWAKGGWWISSRLLQCWAKTVETCRPRCGPCKISYAEVSFNKILQVLTMPSSKTRAAFQLQNEGAQKFWRPFETLKGLWICLNNSQQCSLQSRIKMWDLSCWHFKSRRQTWTPSLTTWERLFARFAVVVLCRPHHYKLIIIGIVDGLRGFVFPEKKDNYGLFWYHNLHPSIVLL